jgi:hypothetical protein
MYFHSSISQLYHYNVSNILSVEHYISTLGGDNDERNLNTFNVYGGRRIVRSRSRSYHFTHKKTNKRRGSKFRHRKSNKRYRK